MADLPRLNEQGRRRYAELRRAHTGRARAMVHWGRVPLGYAAPITRDAYPERGGAAECLAKARRYQARPDAPTVYTSESIWRGRGGRHGRMFPAYGKDDMRWIEDPESVGLRFVGLAHEVCKANHAYMGGIGHIGWFLDDEFQDETVMGVVYQLPARAGVARYLAGYADPFNSDSDGRGPVCLFGEIFESEYTGGCSDSVTLDDGARDAARRADSIAESMAEREREHQAADRAGRAAREEMRESREAGQRYIAALRRVRTMFCARRLIAKESPELGWRGMVTGEIAAARRLRDAWEAARETAFDALDRGYHDSNTWLEGYDSGL